MKYAEVQMASIKQIKTIGSAKSIVDILKMMNQTISLSHPRQQ